MSRTKHRQLPYNPRMWNPPPISPDMPSAFDQPPSVASATECTGLERRPVLSEIEAENYAELYKIHAQKPQGNIGKGNPRNNPSEIAFHRTQE